MKWFIVCAKNKNGSEYTWPIQAHNAVRAAAHYEEMNMQVLWVDDTLVDGRKYWLGATWGTYNETYSCFSLGNCFVNKSETVYKSL